ncbi:hypothetical protein ANAPH2_01518 [Anaplasma phagocytophilum]|nr:hypothetical protein ANAPH2_01518 [Anaplasma phagocytophilum]
MLEITLIAIISSGVKSGKIPEILFAIIDFPVPGGPIISKLCPPAAAISAARFAISCPNTSPISVVKVLLLI